ncbi:putative crinkler family protein [Gigaspora margarita]|uniref:Putative crinkler family protein n=1 Tax=Gigaspora margarita TaxID=4874 RepID=A0A8H3XC35_GIGMA|nr:putative crinkler family protein [Gigaspora margarita]
MTSVTLVFGEDPYDKNFSVEISTSNNVNTLKKAINDDLKSGVATKDFKLFSKIRTRSFSPESDINAKRQFPDDLNSANIEIPSDFLLWIDDLIYAVTDSYVEEEERNQKMRIMFSDKLGTVSEYSKERTRFEQVEVIHHTRLTKSENAAALRPSSSPSPARGSSQPNFSPFLCAACCFSSASVFLSKYELESIRSTIFPYLQEFLKR